MNCIYCSKVCKNKNSLHSHEIRCPQNPNRIETSMSKETRKKISEKMKLNHNNSDREWSQETLMKLKKSGVEVNKKYWTKEKKLEHSFLMKRVVTENPNSYSTYNISGRVKIYEYNGKKLKGKWELLVAKKLDEENIVWDNEIEPIPYFWNGNWHLYFPDFYLKEFDFFIEVKGYERERDRCKWSYVKKPLLILKEKQIKEIEKNKKQIKDYIAGWCNW